MTDHTPDPAHPCVERVPMHRLADGSYSDRCGEPSTDVEYGDEGRYVYHICSRHYRPTANAQALYECYGAENY